MKPSLVAGVVFERRLVVDDARTIGFMGEAGRVYATPALVRDIEHTCRDGLLKHLDAGEDSVGARIELDHLAPTLLGMAVDIRATVTGLKGRLVTLEIVARDPLDQIARGKHVRFVVDTEKTIERLKAKAAKAKTVGVPGS
ncbi:MAG: LysR family transcriptional regulator [Alphaproteobacteria bacterium]|nr:LysR family transcriptional regulator [Alphaproteobacteria bacterium]